MCCVILTIKIYYFFLKKSSVVHNVEEAEILDYCDVITVFINIVSMNFKLLGFDTDVVHRRHFLASVISSHHSEFPSQISNLSNQQYNVCYCLCNYLIN